MSAIPPTIGRARLRQTAAGLRIVIPAQWGWFRFLETPLLAVFVAWMLHESRQPIALWIIGFVLFVLGTGGRWLWSLLGREIVTINKVALKVRHDFGFFGWQRNYFLNRVWGMSFLRLATVSEVKNGTDKPHVGFVRFDCADRASRFQRWLSVAAGLMRIFYDPESPRFGRGLGEAEVQELIGVMESYSGAHLSSTQTPPPRPLPGGILADETNSNWGVTYVMAMMTGVLYYFGMLLDNAVFRYGTYFASLMFAGVGILALAGYRYRFSQSGIEISTLGFRVKFIPVDRITHYEESTREFADSYSFGIYGTRRAYVWAGRGVRIHTLDGEFFIGHMKSAILLRDMELMKQAAHPDQALGHAAGAGAQHSASPTPL